MTTKNGQLNDGREVYLNGHRVVDMSQASTSFLKR